MTMLEGPPTQKIRQDMSNRRRRLRRDCRTGGSIAYWQKAGIQEFWDWGTQELRNWEIRGL